MAQEAGARVRVHYRGTLDDGTEFDSSYSRGEPIEFELGKGDVISGFDDAVLSMDLGDKARVTIASADAYGPHHAEAVQSAPVDKLPEGAGIGDVLTLQGDDGSQIAASITALADGVATLDFNHPLAGKDLTFELELVEVVGA
jgi:FKBP-type peptidyl-prolyl cis-trans isomerase 2